MFWEKIAVLIMQVPWIFSWIINFALFCLHILLKKQDILIKLIEQLRYKTYHFQTKSCNSNASLMSHL